MLRYPNNCVPLHQNFNIMKKSSRGEAHGDGSGEHFFK
jgi:hypothetical protein